ncbi:MULTISPECIES: hypothetical protein [unclassified Microcoleus]|uniref:hypothetical protein n=1 Tax=unclassified Microcoleus TaxID=2642155 RepID=UPI002FD25C6B
MSNLSNIPGGGDLPDRYRNVGEQIQTFFDFAENNPDRAVPFFVNIWETQASLTTRALALQGLGVAAKHYHVKEALADWDVLRDIAKEVKGKGEVSNDLTRWAAASALEAIGYSRQSLQHREGGGFTEPLDRIRREIRDRKLIEINRIPRLNTRGETTAEYQRNLEFWVYGPVEELFAGNDHSPNYQELVKDVIRELHGRGVYLGLISPNLLVQAEALLQAGSIFKESAEIENFLYPFLEEFLHNPNQEISFRINAAEIIHTARDLSRRLKTLSKLLLEEKNPKLQEVVLRQSQSLFKRSAEIEEYLYGLLEEFLHNPNNEASLIIGAVEIIYTSKDLSRKLKTLSQLLLEKTELRNAAVRLLNPYKQELARVNADAYTVLETLNFEYTIDKPEPKDLTIAQMENRISSANQLKSQISTRFVSSIASAESVGSQYRRSASVLKQFLQNKQDEYLSNTDIWIEVLRKQISETAAEQRKVESNQLLIKEAISVLANIVYANKVTSIPEKVCVQDEKFVFSSIKFYTYNQNYQIQIDLKAIKVSLIELIKTDFSLQHFLNYTVASTPALEDLFMTIFELIGHDLHLLDHINHSEFKKVLLVFLYCVIASFVTANYGWIWLIMILIVTIVIKFPFLTKERQIREKKVKDTQSIFYNLNNQWKE